MPTLIDALAELNLPTLARPWALDGDWMIVGDVHVPFTDWGMASKVAAVARREMRKPRRLLIAGDYFDMENFSTWQHVVTPATWAQEREAARLLINEWLETFAEVRLLMGNHERRLQKFTASAFDETDILALVKANPKAAQMSNLGYCTIQSGGVTWRITHPRNYGINQLTVADQLAMKFETNVVAFHEHHLAQGWDRYGRHVIVNGGCLVDPAKLAYVSLDDSKSAGMKRGFVLLKNGVAQLFGEHPFTDWGKYE